MRLLRATLAAGAFILVGIARAGAQGTALVPSGDLAYSDVDRLSQLGILGVMVMGQRPYSRAEFARIVRVARERLDGGSRTLRTRLGEETITYAEGYLRRLEARFGSDDVWSGEPVVSLLDAASLAFTSTDADRRGFPSAYSQVTEATIDPLAERRLGTFAPTGQTAGLELSQRVEPTDWLALQATERGEFQHRTRTDVSKGVAELLLGSARARVHNVAFTLGRQQVTWAQAPDQGLFLASDAPAIDGISVTGDHPFTLPGFLRWFGATQATLVVADLGASVVRSHSKLLTYKVSVSPVSAVEIGGTFMNHFGGTGARSSSATDQLIDFLPFVDVFRRHNYEDTTRALDVDSDKLLGLDGRYRIDQLGGLLLTGELLIDDFDVHDLPNLLTGLGSQTLGVLVPQLGTPTVSLQFNAVHMGTLTYTHTALQNGITTRGRLLGNELGPDAKSFGTQVRWMPSSNVRFELEGRNAVYSYATYGGQYTDSSHTHFVRYKVSNFGNELRDIGLLSLVLQNDDLLAFTIRGGGQRVRNANFLGGTRYDYVFNVAFRIAQ